MNTAEQLENSGEETSAGPRRSGELDAPGLSVAAEIVEVRRNAGVSATVGAVASAVSIAWLGRAIGTGAVLDWVFVVVMGLLSISWLATFVDARTPLLVADAQGVRLRLGRAWLGLPWSAVARVEHRPRRGVLRDGVLNVVPHNPERLLAEVGRVGQRQARIAARLHGGPLAVPLGLSTKVISDADLTQALARLAERDAEVVLIEAMQTPTQVVDHLGDAVEAPAAPHAEPTTVDVTDVQAAPDVDLDNAVVVFDDVEAVDFGEPETPAVGGPRAYLSRTVAGVTAALGRRTSERALLERVEVDEEEPVETTDLLDDEISSETPDPIRSVTPPVRGEVISIAPVADDTSAEEFGPAHDEQEARDGDRTWAPGVHPIAREGHAVAPLIVDDFTVEPASDPVIGPELKAARTRLGLGVDELAERTRIRPHVIEAIEVDDFVPCGGDFYARGHLRTLARVLGIDVAPLLTHYDERYAHAPIDPRRVFEAELATGSHGSIRGTRGGPNWSILVAAVMAVVLVWSVARLVMDAPNELTNTPVLNGSGGPQGAGSVGANPISVKVKAPKVGAEVVIRDANGAVVYQGNLAIGESQVVKAAPPVRVQSSDGSVIVVIDGARRGAIGTEGQPGQGTYAGD